MTLAGFLRCCCLWGWLALRGGAAFSPSARSNRVAQRLRDAGERQAQEDDEQAQYTQRPPQSLGILSWNVLNPAYVKPHTFRQSRSDDLVWSHRIERIAKRIKQEEKADIVCWQEVPSPPSSSKGQRAPRRATRVFSPPPPPPSSSSSFASESIKAVERQNVDVQSGNSDEHPWNRFRQHIVQDLGYTLVTAIPHVTQVREASASYTPHPSICAIAFRSQQWEIVRAESGSHSVLCLLRERFPPRRDPPDYNGAVSLDEVIPRASQLDGPLESESESESAANYLFVASLHLERGAENDVKRMEQMRKVCLRIEQTLQDFQDLVGDQDSDGWLPLVLAGDFNLERNSIIHQWLRAVSPFSTKTEEEEEEEGSDEALAKDRAYVEQLLQQQPRLADMLRLPMKKGRRADFRSLLPLRDVYLDQESSWTGPSTAFHRPWVDYIFVTRDIQIRQCLPTLTPQRSWPSEENPSDHALIGIEMEWPVP